MQRTITLQAALKIIDSGKSFGPIAFVTADKKKNSGGEWIEISSAAKHEFLTRREMDKIAKAAPASNMMHKNPNHYQNSTRNLRLPNGEIRKVHIRLITQFNNLIVT
jgi:hypothetical protein